MKLSSFLDSNPFQGVEFRLWMEDLGCKLAGLGFRCRVEVLGLTWGKGLVSPSNIESLGDFRDILNGDWSKFPIIRGPIFGFPL